MARIELKHLRKEWGTATAVEDISLTIDNGSLVAILGPSGCGKSTTLFMLAGIYAPSAGDILFDGEPVNAVEARDRNVGTVFQSYALYPNMTVFQNIHFPLRFKDVEKTRAAERVREIAALVQVEDLLERRPSQLSGGQQQRVALARALIKEPHLLLLDEPLSNLDATLRLTMRTEIRRIQRKLGVTTVLVTHDQVEATTMADTIICMNAGRIEQTGPADSLYGHPETLFVAGFIGSPPMNLLQAEASGNTLHCGSAVLALSAPLSGPAVLGIRPEDLHIADSGFAATIASVEPMARETLYLADSEFGPIRFLVTGAVPGHRAGERIRLDFTPDRAHLFDPDSQSRIGDARVRSPACSATAQPAA